MTAALLPPAHRRLDSSLPASWKHIADGFSTAGGTPACTMPMMREAFSTPSHNPSDNCELVEELERTHNTGSSAHILRTRSGRGDASHTETEELNDNKSSMKWSTSSSKSSSTSTSAMEEVDDLLSLSLADTAFAFEFEEDCFLRFCSASTSI